MAAGSEVPQKGVLQATGYSPVETRLNSPIQLPGTGELWAKVGQTAMDAVKQAGQMLQASPLNPEVKAQMQAQMAASQAGINHYKWMSSLPNNFGQLLQYTDAQGNVVSIAPGQIQDPTTLANLQAAMKVGAGGGNTGHGAAPDVNKDTARDGSDGSTTTTGDQSFEGSEYPPAGQQPQQPQQPKKKQPPTAEEQAHPGSTQVTQPNLGAALASTLVPSQGGSTAAATAGGPGQLNTGQPQSPDIQSQSAADYQAQYQAAHPDQFQGYSASAAQIPAAPSGQGQTPPRPPQASSIYSPMRQAPGAPAAPSAPQPQNVQGPPSQSPAAATQADQVAMAQWQAQNAHPVMSSQDALAWMKGQTTLAQDATYLPMGGPGGSPAFAFHMKGQGAATNIVPVSQMIQKGAGPLVAAQNTSQVISATDQAQQQPGAQGQPPAPQDQTQVATPPNLSPPSPANLPSVAQSPGTPPRQFPNVSPPTPVNLPQYPNLSGPPPAPTGPLPGAQAQPQYPNISPPVPPPAPGTVGAARMPITDAQGNPISTLANVPSKGGTPVQYLGAQTTPTAVVAQPIQPQRDMWDVVPPAQQTSIAANAKAMGDVDQNAPYAGDRRVEGDTGQYTYYINDDPNSRSRGRVYTVLPGPSGHYYDESRWYLGKRDYETYTLPDAEMKQHMKDYWSTNAGQLTPEEIDAMSPAEMKPWLQRAWYNDHVATSSPTQGYNSDLDAAENHHKSLNRIANLLQSLDNHGYGNLNSKDRVQSVGGNTAQGVGVPPQFAGIDSKSAQAMRDLDQEVAYDEELLRTHPGLQARTSESQGLDLQKIAVPTRLGTYQLPNVGGSTPLSDIAFSGEDLPTKLARLHSMQLTGNARYKDLIRQGNTQRMAVDPKHDANVIRINKGQEIADEGDQYTAHSYPGDPQTVRLKDLPQFLKNNPSGTQFMTYGKNAHLMAVP